jgi:hypothetical protein
LDLWHHEIEEWLPAAFKPAVIRQQTYFGSLFQTVAITK